MNKKNKKKPWIIIITGPTASGKTALSEIVAEKLNGEIINVDVGQFYKNFAIGTAKPNWKSFPFPCHMFDILDKPQDLSAADYRKQVLILCESIVKRNKTPIIVGGSLFYIKSLFFPPRDTVSLAKEQTSNYSDEDTGALWEKLASIDSSRAQSIHRNDRYRIVRALSIWRSTGKKPSNYKPQFSSMPYNVLIVPIIPSRSTIHDRINKRTLEMIHEEGWIDEAERLYGTEWQPFILRKGLIGYPELFDWISRGKKKEDLAGVIETIQQKTRRYAKRQITFWRGLEQQLVLHSKKNENSLSIQHITQSSYESFEKEFYAIQSVVKQPPR